MQHRNCDVLIIGGGGAALYAAIHAHDAGKGLKVLLASKGLVGKSGCTRMVQGGYNVVLNPEDSFDKHYDDTLRGGSLINDQELAWILVTQAPERIYEMENAFGCYFDRNGDGSIHQRALAGQSFNRTVHRGDLTGIELMSRLHEQVLARDIECLSEVRGVDLLFDTIGSRVSGALLLDYQSGELTTVSARAVLLATGGSAPLYKITAASAEKTGDGLAMAFRAGAEMVDMEMMQFHPTGLIAGSSMLTGTVLEEGLRGAGGHLLNAQHERFMQRYDPAKMERSTRDRVSRSSFLEVRAGRGTAEEGVYLDVRHLGKEFLLKSSPGMYRRCMSIGVDMATDLIQVTPTAHFQMGGVRIDTQCRSSLEGLFAAGEDAGGVHGANRLGGNGVAESMVFGALAGKAIAEYAAGSAQPRVDMAAAKRAAARVSEPRAGQGDCFELHTQLRELAWQHLGIIRSAKALKFADAELSRLEGQAQALEVPADRAANALLHEKMDIENLLCVARLIGTAAALRPESRGSHYREDFPDLDEKYLVNTLLRREPDGSVASELKPVRFSRRTPEQLRGETLIPKDQTKPSAAAFSSEVN